MVVDTNSLTVVTFRDLSPDDQELVVASSRATADAHNPHFRRWWVGSALRLNREEEMEIITRANWEHPTPQLSTCAERRLIDSIPPDLIPIAEAMAVVGRRPRMSDIILTPCDICRPVIRDFAEKTNKGNKFLIILAPWNFRRGKLIVFMAEDIRLLPDYDPNGINWRDLV